MLVLVLVLVLVPVLVLVLAQALLLALVLVLALVLGEFPRVLTTNCTFDTATSSCLVRISWSQLRRVHVPHVPGSCQLVVVVSKPHHHRGALVSYERCCWS